LSLDVATRQAELLPSCGQRRAHELTADRRDSLAAVARGIVFRLKVEAKKGKKGKKKQKRILRFFALLALFASLLQAIQKERVSQPTFSCSAILTSPPFQSVST
jgi:hypothetical protein